MFWFKGNKICFSNGKEHIASEYLCSLAARSKLVYSMLSDKAVKNSADKISCFLKDGNICYDTENEEAIASICASYVFSMNIPLCKCNICGTHFVPKKRSDEIYCEKCRKTGPLKTFRQKSGNDEGYALFIQYTKHLRYLKSKDKLTASAFERYYSEAKQALNDLRNEKISMSAFKNSLGKVDAKPTTAQIESYLL